LKAGIDFSVTIAGRGLSALTSMGWIVASARLYSAAEVSFLAQLAIAASLIETMKGFGLGGLLVQRLPVMERDDAGADRLLRTYFMAVGGLLCAVNAVSLFAAPLHWKWGLVAVCFQSLSGSWTLILQSSSRFLEASTTNLVFGLVSRGIPAGAAWIFHLELMQMLQLTAILSGVFVTGTMLKPAIRIFNAGTKLIPWTQLWPDARHFFYAGWLRYGATQLDQVFAAILLPHYALAVYYVFRRLYSVAVMVIDAGVDVLTPRLVKAAGGGPLPVTRLLTSVLRKSLPPAMCSMGLIAWNRESLAALLFGAEYARHADLVMWLSASALAYGLYSVTLSAAVTAGGAERFARLIGLAAITNTVAVAVCSPWLGIVSLPLAMSGGYTVAYWVGSRQAGCMRDSTGRMHVWAATAVFLALLGSVGLSKAATWHVRAATAGCALLSLFAVARSVRVHARGDR
jgi:O-antigen/teichoic acid export membrane protein